MVSCGEESQSDAEMETLCSTLLQSSTNLQAILHSAHSLLGPVSSTSNSSDTNYVSISVKFTCIYIVFRKISVFFPNSLHPISCMEESQLCSQEISVGWILHNQQLPSTGEGNFFFVYYFLFYPCIQQQLNKKHKFILEPSKSYTIFLVNKYYISFAENHIISALCICICIKIFTFLNCLCLFCTYMLYKYMLDIYVYVF